MRKSDETRLAQAVSQVPATVILLTVADPSINRIFQEGLALGRTVAYLLAHDALERAGFGPVVVRNILDDIGQSTTDARDILTNPPTLEDYKGASLPSKTLDDMLKAVGAPPRPHVDAATDVEGPGDESPTRYAYGNDGTDGSDVVTEPVGIPGNRPGWNVPPIDCTPDNLCDVCRETGLAGGNHV